MDSLAMLVTETLRRDAFCGDLFVFRSKRSDRVKILAWDGTGLVLYSKRLETGRFTWPAIQDGVITLTASQHMGPCKKKIGHRGRESSRRPQS
jgi:transposase